MERGNPEETTSLLSSQHSKQQQRHRQHPHYASEDRQHESPSPRSSSSTTTTASQDDIDSLEESDDGGGGSVVVRRSVVHLKLSADQLDGSQVFAAAADETTRSDAMSNATKVIHIGDSSADESDALITAGTGKDDDDDEEDDGDEHDEQHLTCITKWTSSFSVCFNLVNTTIGAGVLSLPFAFHESGMLGGPIMLLCISLLSCYTLFVLMNCADKVQKFSYKELATAIFPVRFMGHVMEAVLFFFCFSGLVGYCFLIGQFLELQMKDWLLGSRLSPSGFETEWSVILSNRSFMMSVPMVFIIFPLCCLRKINFLSYTSFYSIICATFVIVSVVVRSIIANTSTTRKELGKGSWRLIGTVDSLFIAFPIICFSMASHITLLPMYSTMKNRYIHVPFVSRESSTVSRGSGSGGSGRGRIKLMKVLTVLCMAACFLLYLVIGVFGYLHFREDTKDNILNNYPADDPLNIVAKLAIVLVVIFSFPLLHFACREAIEKMVFPNRPVTTLRWVTEAAVICGLVFAMAAIVPDLQTAFGITGATAGCLVVYTFPALMYFRVTESLLQKTVAMLVVIFSVLMGVASTVVLIIDAVRDHLPIMSV